MALIIIALIAFTFIVFAELMRLSILIDHLRNEKEGERSSLMWEFFKSGGISNHLWPGPFFSEFNDTDEIKDLIKKRNQLLAVFWIVVALAFLAQFLFHPVPTKPIRH